MLCTGIGCVKAMEILQAYDGEGIESLKKIWSSIILSSIIVYSQLLNSILPLPYDLIYIPP